MHTPVFLDHLPDISSVIGRKPEIYRLTRNKALVDLLLDDDIHWQDRAGCPACGQDRSRSQGFDQTLMPFQRCTGCNTIYAIRTPDQQVLDRLRLDQPTHQGQATNQDREFEFISILNWISLTEARLGRTLETVLDFRFCSQAPGWQDATARLSRKRDWSFLPLEAETGPDNFARLKQVLRTRAPKAVLVLAELDRVADPRLLLRSIRENVAAGTLVFAASSCADGLEYEILGADSPSFIPLDRLNVFSIRGFETLARSAGFDVLEVSTPGRRDAVILDRYFKSAENSNIPFWSGFFKDADKDRLRDLQILLQRSLKSGVMRFALEA